MSSLSTASGGPPPAAVTVAIVGRPNVGKSTLFNRLVGRRLAIVDDTPGVTRDRREGDARLGDLAFRVVDTAGLEETPEGWLDQGMQAQTSRALGDADVVVFVVDARAGITEIDRHFARQLRRLGKPIVLVANKAEGRAGIPGIGEAFGLGLGDPIPLSAEHGEGLADLYDALAVHVAVPPEDADAEAEEAARAGLSVDVDAPDDPERPIQLAIVGRPNVGKSTLVNGLLHEERVMTGPEPGVTRDAIAIDWTWDGRPVRLVDTAGLRKRARLVERLEKLSAEDTLRAIRFAQVVVLVVDGTQTLDRQDLTIADHVAREGRAMVLAVNKWDLVEDGGAALERVRDRLATSLPQLRGVPVVSVSALTGLRLDRLMRAVLGAYDVWNRRISTGQLNRWLEDVLSAHPPPLVGGRALRLRYITQIKRRPPTFLLFANRPDEVPDDYRRYLMNGLREAFDLPGVPIRLELRAGRNPYGRDHARG